MQTHSKEIITRTTRRFLWSLQAVGCLLCLMPGVAGADAPPVKQTPIRVSYTPLVFDGKASVQPLIKVRLNRTTEATFFVDTGSVTSVISTPMAKKLGLRLVPAVDDAGKPFDLSGGNTQMGYVSSLAMGDVAGAELTFTDQPLIVVDEKVLRFDSHSSFDGIIGANLLGQFATLINPQDHTLLLLYPGNLSPDQLREAGITSPHIIPLSRHKGYTAWYVTARFRNGDHAGEGELKLDTGSNTTIITGGLADRLRLTPTATSKNATFDGEFSLNVASVGSMGLGDLTLPYFSVQYQPDPHVFSTPILGLDALAGNRVLIDIPGGKMYLQPLPPPAHKITIGPSTREKPASAP